MFGYYINLDKRKDRNSHMKNIIKSNPFFEKVERISAIYSETYGVGCTMSHIKCITNLLKRNDKYYIILEDDFCFLNKEKFDNFTTDFDKIKNDDNWDIIVLTPRGKTIEKHKINNFHRIVNNQTTTGYIIKHDFIPKLLSVYKSAVVKLMKGYNGPLPNPYCTDQCWKPLQLNSNFLYYKDIYGGQLPCYSDIEKIYVDYNKKFLDQIYY